MSGKHDEEQQRRIAHAAKKENILGKTEQATEPNVSEKSSQCGQSLIYVSYVDYFLS